MRQHAEIGFA
jgi:hypothetical protein